MWRNPPTTPETHAQFQDWILSIYDDAASYAVRRLRLPLAQAVNDAIFCTLEELEKRNAPADMIAAIEEKLKGERPTLMRSLARQLNLLRD